MKRLIGMLLVLTLGACSPKNLQVLLSSDPGDELTNAIFLSLYILTVSRWLSGPPPTEAIPVTESPATRKAIAPNAVTLSNSVPIAPFTGNTTIVSGRGNSSPVADIGLIRQPDCSLSAYVFQVKLEATSRIAKIIPNAQTFLRTQAGLPVLSSATFARGCTDRTLGVAGASAVYLGRSPAGRLLGAVIDYSSNVVLISTDATGSVVTQATVATNVNSLLVTGDLNGDGIGDLIIPRVTVGANAGVGVVLSNADGTFRPMTVIPLGNGNPAVLHGTIDDVNGDGKLDFVAMTAVAGGATNNVVAMLGDGQGGLTSAMPTALSGAAPIVSADFNGDAKKDILLANGQFLAGRGDGTFASPVVAMNVLISAGTIAIGDFDNDGKLDAAVAGPIGSPIISVYAGNGNGTFTLKASAAGMVGSSRLGVTDLDGDGNLDLVVGTVGPGLYGWDLYTGGRTQYLFGLGDGSFAGAQAIASPLLTTGTAAANAPSFAVADFNGDTRADVIASSPRSLNGGSSGPLSFVLYPGSATGKLGAGGAPIVTTLIDVKMVSAGDVNGDGKMDLILASRNALTVLPGLGNGTFGAQLDQSSLAQEPIDLRVADFNGDGRADVVALMPDISAHGGASGVFVFFGQANGSLSTGVQIDPSSTAGALAVGDLNGDGRADIVAGDRQGSGTAVRIYLGNANGTFTAPAPISLASTYFVLGVADMNADGKADLVIGGADPATQITNLYVHLGAGTGAFQSPKAFPIPNGLTDGLTAMALADFDGDGKVDAIITRSQLSTFVIGAGDGTFLGQVGARHCGQGEVSGRRRFECGQQARHFGSDV